MRPYSLSAMYMRRYLCSMRLKERRRLFTGPASALPEHSTPPPGLSALVPLLLGYNRYQHGKFQGHLVATSCHQARSPQHIAPRHCCGLVLYVRRSRLHGCGRTLCLRQPRVPQCFHRLGCKSSPSIYQPVTATPTRNPSPAHSEDLTRSSVNEGNISHS